MTTLLIFFCATVVLWWAGTGVIMLTGRLESRGVRWAVAVLATVMAGGALAVLAGLPAVARPWSVGVELLCALTIWGWVETTLYAGALTGPEGPTLPAGATEWERFAHAFRANLHHELATVVAVLATWGASRLSGGTAFAPGAVLALALMHESARLNVLLGVRNLNADLLPGHLAHFRVYFRERSWNWFFPVALAVHAVGAVWLGALALSAGAAEPAVATGYGLVAGLVALGFLEHLALMLPFRPEVLWGWAMGRVG
jgi:putative photosynthetic complex assembly protein 2